MDDMGGAFIPDEPEDDSDIPNVIPTYSKATHGARTIFVTQQFRSFEDDYCKVRSIGEPGQFGTAYECYLKKDHEKARRCVKEINKARFHHISVEARQEILNTMQNEITTLKRVDHPNIVELYDVYEDRHFLHLVMEYLSGGELFARIVEKDSFNEREAANVLKQILEALDHMHSQNILHLDLKPDNILYANKDEDSPIKLIDFGMARVVPRLAKLKDRVGTPTYMAPEVWSGNYSKAADVWSVGVILFCMLFGFPPFYADTNILHLDEFAQLEKLVLKGFSPIIKPGYGAWFPDSSEVSENCRYLITKMLEMNVSRRWTVKECLSSQWVRGFGSENTIPAIVKDALRKFHGTCKFKVAISNIFIHQLDQDHVAEIKKFFNELDADNDGAITLLEFKHGMQTKFNTELSDEQLDVIFSTIDLDDNRTITFAELITITTHRMLVDEDERLFQAFADIDENGDGVISRDELEKAMQRINNQHSSKQGKAVMQRVKTAFTAADRNGDGNIDYEEFLRILHPDFADDMDFDSFKNPRESFFSYKGAHFNVHNTGGQTPIISHEPERKIDDEFSLLGCIAEETSIVTDITNTDDFKQDIVLLNDEIRALQSANEVLEERVLKAEEARDNIRIQYEDKLFSKLETQTIAMSDLRAQWQESHEKQLSVLHDRIQLKDEQLHKKDELMLRLNSSIEKKNMKLEQYRKVYKDNMSVVDKKLELKDAEIYKLKYDMKHAEESKMRTLQNCTKEIDKLKEMLRLQQSNENGGGK